MSESPQSTPQVTPSKSFYATHKSLVLIGSGLVALLIVATAVVLVLSNANANNAKSAMSPSGFEYLPSGICPGPIRDEGGERRADYQGKPYVVRNSEAAWIEENCGNDNTPEPQPEPMPVVPDNQGSQESDTIPPLKLKSIGFDLGAYNASTATAGAVKFTKIPLMFEQIFSPYGQQDPRSPNDPTKRNPQPTVILPLGTDVLSLVDGIVVDVKELYSGDWTIMVSSSMEGKWFYETEHISDPLVQKGDTVKGGQVIGKVSSYDSRNHPGFGLVEIGILHSNAQNRPEHVCPFLYLDSSIEAEINANLNSLYAGWNAYLGKEIYKYTTFETPGCVTSEPFAE